MSTLTEAPSPPRRGGRYRPQATAPRPRAATSPERNPACLRRDLRSIVGDGAAFSVMVGIGETYLPAFVLALGMGEITAGLIATLPLLAGALLQTASPTAVRLLRSHRRWVVLCVLAQAASFIPLIVAALVHHMPAPAMFLIAAVYWGAGLASGPAWNTWVGTLVPPRIRAPFFARRTRLIQAGTLCGFLAGGMVLQWAANYGDPLTAFALLFAVAGGCRFASARFLALQNEPEPPHDGHRRVKLGELIQRVRFGSGRFLLYLVAIQLSVQVSSGYFTPYMLKQLKFSYLTYVAVVASAYLAKAVSLPLWGRVAQRYGARRLLWVGGIGIVPLSACWLISQDWWFLVLIQVGGGVMWAAYELAMFLMFFDDIRAEERTSVLTMYNVAHAVATLCGGMLGAAILATLDASPAAYLALFACSSFLRLSALGILAWSSRPAVAPQPQVGRTIWDDEPTLRRGVLAPTPATLTTNAKAA